MASTIKILKKYQPVIISIMIIIGGWIFGLSKGLIVQDLLDEYPKIYSSELVNGWGADANGWIVFPGYLCTLYLILWCISEFLNRHIFKSWIIEFSQQLLFFLILIIAFISTSLFTLEIDIPRTIIEDNNFGLLITVSTINISIILYLGHGVFSIGKKVCKLMSKT